MKFNPPSDVQSGNYLETEGVFHCAVEKIEEDPVNKNNERVDGVVAECSVLDGTVRVNDICTVAGRKFRLYLRHGQETHKDRGEYARKLQARFFIAVGLMKPSELGKEGLDIDVPAGKGRQFVVALKKGGKDGKYLEPDGLKIWHIDDPECTGIPKDQSALKTIPAALRINAGDFSALNSGGESGGPSQPIPDSEFDNL